VYESNQINIYITTLVNGGSANHATQLLRQMINNRTLGLTLPALGLHLEQPMPLSKVCL